VISARAGAVAEYAGFLFSMIYFLTPFAAWLLVDVDMCITMRTLIPSISNISQRAASAIVTHFVLSQARAANF